MKISEGEAGSVLQFVATYGALGLFVLSLLDGAFLPLPSLTDALLFVLSAARPEWMLLYVGAATVGTTLGCIILYLVSRRAGHHALERFPERKRARVQAWIEKYDLFAVLAASLAPPPFPFKLIVITAGVLRFDFFRFTLAVLAGRLVRSFAEGYVAARYGAQAEDIFRHYYPFIALAFFSLAALWALYQYQRRRRLRNAAVVADELPEAGG